MSNRNNAKGTLANRIAVVGAVRTPQAKAFGALQDVSAVDLAQHAVEALLARTDHDGCDVDEVIFGNVAGPADAPNIARVIALRSRVPVDRIAHTVNRNCASGMESIIAASHALQEGRARLVVTGGTESMSNVPLLVSDSLKAKLLQLGRSRSFWTRVRSLARLRKSDFRFIPALELGLTDPVCGLNMAQTAECLAKDFSISRSEQDAFALHSHQKACAASERCFLSGEIAAMKVGGLDLSRDVGPRAQQSMDQLAKLRPINGSASGTVTAGNSCPLTDGASALLLTTESFASRQQGHAPMGFVSAYAIAGCPPDRMGLGPVYAIAKLLRQTGLTLDSFDLFEINEAFAAQVLACLRACESRTFAEQHLNGTVIGTIDPEKLNVHGGAIALGHPLGSTGSRIVMTLIRALREKGLRRGLATLCVGGGQGVAMLVETE